MGSKWIYTLVICSLAAGLLSACQKQGPKAKSYSRDGMLGITEVNPNMPMSPSYHHYTDDTNVMKEAVAQVPQVTASSITLNGPNATVTVTVPASLSDAEAEAVRLDALDKLTKAAPRYTVKVAVKRK